MDLETIERTATTRTDVHPRAPSKSPATHRLVVRSIGKATPALCAALSKALPFAPEHLARCLYQAPSVLLDGLPELEARAIGEVLARAGLAIDAVPMDQPFEPGRANLELAVHLTEPARLREVAVALAAFLGCAVPRAVNLLCAAPPMVLGQVSRATADALAERLVSYGAEVDVSCTAEARYDIFIDADAADLRARLVRELAGSGIKAEREGVVLALGAPRAVAESLWARIGTDSKWRMLDHAFQRFDVVLEGMPDTPEAAEVLAAVSGMPTRLAPKARERLPLVLCTAVRGAEASEALARLSAAGMTASARLITLATWDIVISAARDPRAAAEVLACTLERERPQIDLTLRRLPARIDSAVGLTRGRWIVHELAQLGAKATLEER